jgi:hypothetical protein
MSDLYLPARFHIPSRRKFLECELDIKCTVSGKYKVQIVRDGKVIREPFGDKWLPNLITNQGFDQIFNNGNAINTCMAAIRAGTSATAPTNADTNLNANWGGTTTVTGSGASSTNDTTNGACTHTVSFDFAAAASGVTLNEVALATAATNIANIFTHALFPSPVTLNTGDVLRVAYTVTWSIPATVTAVPISLSAINGFNISGNMKVCGTFAQIFGAQNAAGSWTALPNNHYIFNAATAGGGSGLCSAPTTFPAVNTTLNATQIGSGVTGTLGSYTNGSFSRNQTFVWVPSNPTTTVSNVYGIATGLNFSTATYILLNAAQTKANTNTLTVITNCTLARA